MEHIKNRVFVLGLDSATWDLLIPWIEDGLMPNFSRLTRKGVWGLLESTLHPLSPPAWTSFITGKNPGKHGIYDFVVHKPDSYELLYTNGGMRRGDSFWKLLSEYGKKVVVLNVPMTYPPEKVNGIMISGFDSPGVDSDFVYPPHILGNIKNELGEYILRDYPQGQDPSSFLKQIHKITEFHHRLTTYMMKEYKWDFFMMVFNSLDLIQHGYWQYMDDSFTEISPEDHKRYGNAIKDCYIKVDQILGDIITMLPEKTDFIVMSDHGAGPCHKAIFINKWLESIGLLTYSSNGNKDISLSAVKRLHHIIKKTVPPQGLEWLKRRFPDLRQKVKSNIVFSEIDWKKTKVYSFGRESTNLFINMEGKMPMGIVKPGKEYETLRERVIDELKKLKDPETGEPVVEGVYRREEVYHGGCIDFAPDLLVTWKGHRYTSWPGYDDRNKNIFESSLKHSDYSDWSSLQKGGNHRPNGILMMSGDGIKQGYKVNGARIIDLAPTILGLMGVPVPRDMDGKILEEVLTASLRPYLKTDSKVPNRVESDPREEGHKTYTEEDAKKIEERLKSLGYVD